MHAFGNQRGGKQIFESSPSHLYYLIESTRRRPGAQPLEGE
jgi:hypothetical protein